MPDAANDCDGDGHFADDDLDDWDVCIDNGGIVPGCSDNAALHSDSMALVGHAEESNTQATIVVVDAPDAAVEVTSTNPQAGLQSEVAPVAVQPAADDTAEPAEPAAVEHVIAEPAVVADPVAVDSSRGLRAAPAESSDATSEAAVAAPSTPRPSTSTSAIEKAPALSGVPTELAFVDSAVTVAATESAPVAAVGFALVSVGFGLAVGVPRVRSGRQAER